MSSKIKYRVIHCSSFEAGYPPTELEQQGQNTKGWQSSRFCEFPQEIVIAFDRVYEISQVWPKSIAFLFVCLFACHPSAAMSAP
jgi:hypothetical protein